MSIIRMRAGGAGSGSRKMAGNLVMTGNRKLGSKVTCGLMDKVEL